jgi:hypothetical protein
LNEFFGLALLDVHKDYFRLLKAKSFYQAGADACGTTGYEYHFVA